MLSQFEKPPIVVCVLCRGTVSLRKGDKSRFYNHISQDHEVHYDMELFFTLSYLEEEEKETFITVMNKKIDKNSLDESPESDMEIEAKMSDDDASIEENESNVEEDQDYSSNLSIKKSDLNTSSETLLEESHERNMDKETTLSDTTVEENESNGNVEEIQNNSIEKSNEDTTSSWFSDSSNDVHKSTYTPLTSTVSMKMKEKQRCSQCKINVPKRSIQIHMKLKHKKHIRMTSCQFCEKIMSRNNLKRHLKVHGIMEHKMDKTPPAPSVKQETPEEGNIGALDLRTDKALNSEGSNLPVPNPSTNTLDEIDHVIGDEWERIGEEWHRINTLKRKNQTESRNVTVKKESNENTVTTASQEENVNKPSIVSQNTETITQSTQAHEKTKTYMYRKCQKCQKPIKRIHFNRHMKDIHSGRRKYSCCLCHSSFNRKEHLYRHIKNVHKQELNLVDKEMKPKFSKDDCKILCKNCDMKFISEESKNFHNDRIHGKGKHKCDMCNKKKTNIKLHKMTCKGGA